MAEMKEFVVRMSAEDRDVLHYAVSGLCGGTFNKWEKTQDEKDLREYQKYCEIRDRVFLQIDEGLFGKEWAEQDTLP